ncbi:MAG TPA: hypothetical protein VJ063_07045 [Verrucomicrobiae bacterium]|nr:hypothetical protein [Verrucomicrobiae bacterium]
MKVHASATSSKATFALWLGLLIFATNAPSARAAYYQVGQVVTNFVLYARPWWTNSAGFEENAPMRLPDFAGKIIFVEFFDPT